MSPFEELAAQFDITSPAQLNGMPTYPVPVDV